MSDKLKRIGIGAALAAGLVVFTAIANLDATALADPGKWAAGVGVAALREAARVIAAAIAVGSEG